jgi:hypothetical protein
MRYVGFYEAEQSICLCAKWSVEGKDIASLPNKTLQGRHGISKNAQVRTKAKLCDATKQRMDMLESNPERTRSFFQDKRVNLCSLNF